MASEVFVASTIPAGLAFIARAVKTGYELAGASEEVTQLLKTIDQLKGIIDATKSRLLLPAGDVRSVSVAYAELEAATIDLEDALRVVERHVEPARKDMFVRQGRMAPTTRVKWVLRDSVSLQRTMDRLILAVSVFLQREQNFRMPGGQMGDQSPRPTVLDGSESQRSSSPPPYLDYTDETKRAMQQRRESREKWKNLPRQPSIPAKRDTYSPMSERQQAYSSVRVVGPTNLPTPPSSPPMHAPSEHSIPPVYTGHPRYPISTPSAMSGYYPYYPHQQYAYSPWAHAGWGPSTPFYAQLQMPDQNQQHIRPPQMPYSQMPPQHLGQSGLQYPGPYPYSSYVQTAQEQETEFSQQYRPEYQATTQEPRGVRQEDHEVRAISPIQEEHRDPAASQPWIDEPNPGAPTQSSVPDNAQLEVISAEANSVPQPEVEVTPTKPLPSLPPLPSIPPLGSLVEERAQPQASEVASTTPPVMPPKPIALLARRVSVVNREAVEASSSDEPAYRHSTRPHSAVVSSLANERASAVGSPPPAYTVGTIATTASTSEAGLAQVANQSSLPNLRSPLSSVTLPMRSSIRVGAVRSGNIVVTPPKDDSGVPGAPQTSVIPYRSAMALRNNSLTTTAPRAIGGKKNNRLVRWEQALNAASSPPQQENNYLSTPPVSESYHSGEELGTDAGSSREPSTLLGRRPVIPTRKGSTRPLRVQPHARPAAEGRPMAVVRANPNRASQLPNGSRKSKSRIEWQVDKLEAESKIQTLILRPDSR